SDRPARLLGLSQRGGPAVERSGMNGRPERFALPRPMSGRAEPHFSFAGLKTAVRHQAQALAPLSTEDVADLCAAFELAAAQSVADRGRLAMAMVESELSG